ncbi:hypothetical protein ACIRPH_30850 [Nocardiopsis sp. NPDC101807]|uniref:hypothetical protein n=1 Tax=Nocardiopsis sp. NPDC101807 TaxID=3364339 RepID=UPI0037FE8136
MRPSPQSMVTLLRQRPIQLVPAAPAPKPIVRTDGPCGFCEHDRADHGTRYSTFGGAHEWLPRHPGSHITALHPIGDDR